jgi:2-polyprenyl-3-methyl-5-hydroxy-6-metoxy-1,4-benzoquinol methylase
MPDLFDEKAHEWDQRPVPQQISETVGDLLRSKIEWAPTMRVMDFGAGTGLVAAHLAPLVARVAAVDTSSAMLEQLATKSELRGKVEIHCQDILEKPLAEPVDGIVSAMALHHVEDTGALVRAFGTHVKTGGFVALADLDTEDGSFHPPGTEGVCHFGFDRDRLADELRAAGFEEVEFCTALEISRESGTYPIFLVTARRR